MTRRLRRAIACLAVAGLTVPAFLTSSAPAGGCTRAGSAVAGSVPAPACACGSGVGDTGAGLVSGTGGGSAGRASGCVAGGAGAASDFGGVAAATCVGAGAEGSENRLLIRDSLALAVGLSSFSSSAWL